MNNLQLIELKKPEVKYEGVTFHIKKLSAFRAMDVVEILRVSLADIFDSVEISNGGEEVAVIKSLMKLPRDILKEVQDILFSNVWFTKTGEVEGGLPLEPQYYDMAFEKLDVFNIYELIARCLVINFFCTAQKWKDFTKLVVPTPLTKPKA